MSRAQYGYLVWGILAVFVAVSELIPVIFDKKVPWPTLSETAWNLQQISSWFSILFLAGLEVLTFHIVFHWPSGAPPGVPNPHDKPPVLPNV